MELILRILVAYALVLTLVLASAVAESTFDNDGDRDPRAAVQNLNLSPAETYDLRFAAIVAAEYSGPKEDVLDAQDSPTLDEPLFENAAPPLEHEPLPEESLAEEAHAPDPAPPLAPALVPVARTPPVAPAPAPPTAPPPISVAAQASPDLMHSPAQTLLEAHNAERARRGLPPLGVDATLASIASSRASDMAARDYFSHNPPGGQSSFAMMDAVGFNARVTAENIAWNTYPPDQSVSTVMQSFMGSGDHARHVLDAAYSRIGIGVATRGDAKYYVVLFAST